MSRDPCRCSIALKDPKQLFCPSFVVRVPEPWGAGHSKRFVCSRCGERWEWTTEKGWFRGDVAPRTTVTLPELIPIPAAPKNP